MQILFSEYPDAYIDVCFCHDALAEYYYNKGDYYQSYEHYEKIREYNLIHPQAKCCNVTSEFYKHYGYEWNEIHYPFHDYR